MKYEELEQAIGKDQAELLEKFLDSVPPEMVDTPEYLKAFEEMSKTSYAFAESLPIEGRPYKIRLYFLKGGSGVPAGAFKWEPEMNRWYRMFPVVEQSLIGVSIEAGKSC